MSKDEVCLPLRQNKVLIDCSYNRFSLELIMRNLLKIEQNIIKKSKKVMLIKGSLRN